MINDGHILAAFVWPIQLEYLRAWQAMLLFAGMGVIILWLGMRSLTGLGPVRKWVAIGFRLAVLLAMVLIVAGVRWTRVNRDVEVIVLRDISMSTDNVVDYPGQTLTTSIDEFLRALADTARKPRTDRVGVISFSDVPLIDMIPNTQLSLEGRAIRSAGSTTDISSAIQLGLATLGKDAMHRLLLITDGNSTAGDIESAIAAAASARVPIDVMPLSYDAKNEVLVERFIAPTWKRENEPFSIEVILRSTNVSDVTGKLTVTHQGRAMPINPGGADPYARIVTLKPGRNVERVQVPPLTDAGVHQFRAVFEAPNVAADVAGAPGSARPTTRPGGAVGIDTMAQNNAADAFTFVRGQGKVLYIDNVPDGRGQILRRALGAEGINLDTQRVGVDQFPRSLVEMQNFDAVILANVPYGAGGLNEEQQKMLASYVHDLGGGLVMIGGDQAFGAGGWANTRLEQVLPVNMDIPAQRQIPKGALVLIMHATEMPDGNYWAEQCALRAIEALSAKDEIGVISLDWAGRRAAWDFALQEKGDGTKAAAAVKNMQMGDFKSWEEGFQLAMYGTGGVGGLLNSDARQKHIIVISDGDPAAPSNKTLQDLVNNRISVSTVSVYPHDRNDRGLPPAMRRMAIGPNGEPGNAYGPIDSDPSQLPQIFVKEATVVRRSLIQEDANGIAVNVAPTSSELIRGLAEIPPVRGMVLTTRKPDPQVQVPLTAGVNNDPILAHWQSGLGKSVAFTADAHNRWSPDWVGSGTFAKFWAQVVRYVSRPPMSTDLDVQTVLQDGKGRITVEALSNDAAFLNFLSIAGQVVGPDMQPRTVRLVQTGPGTYVGEFDAKDAGNYVAVLNYRTPGNEQGVMLSGLSVSSIPELRDLRSNEAVMRRIAESTGGTYYERAFDPEFASPFRREGLAASSSPMPVWDLLVPWLLALILLDVATRRIAWDWNSTKRLATAAVDRVRAFTSLRKVESRPTLDALRQVRENVQQSMTSERAGTPTETVVRPDPRAKFEAKGVEGDIAKVVGGATDKPIPSAPKTSQTKADSPDKTRESDAFSGLMAAKKRARDKIREKEEGKE